MHGTGCYYKLNLNKWEYGLFKNNSKKIDKTGDGYPITILSLDFSLMLIAVKIN